jgi:hypothetical protein
VPAPTTRPSSNAHRPAVGYEQHDHHRHGCLAGALGLRPRRQTSTRRWLGRADAGGCRCAALDGQ